MPIFNGQSNDQTTWKTSEDLKAVGYPLPRPLTDCIKGRIAFWKVVQVIKD